jgi:hypothetical protein
VDALLGQHADTIPTPKTGSQSYIAAMITRTTAMTVIGVQDKSRVDRIVPVKATVRPTVTVEIVNKTE